MIVKMIPWESSCLLTHSVSRSSKLSYLLNQGFERVALESGVDFRGYLKEVIYHVALASKIPMVVAITRHLGSAVFDQFSKPYRTTCGSLMGGEIITVLIPVLAEYKYSNALALMCFRNLLLKFTRLQVFPWVANLTQVIRNS